MIFVFVFLITDISIKPGAWSAMINPSPYVLISAIELANISTDFPSILEPSLDCSVEVRFNILCASSNTVTCLRGSFPLTAFAILYSCNFITNKPMISDLVSLEPVRLRSIITFSSNSSFPFNSSLVKICPYKPFVKDFSLVQSAPL